MESETLIGSTVVLSAFAGACVLLLLYIVRTLNGEQKHNASTSSTGARNASNKHEHASNENKRKEPANLKNKKKTGDSRWTGRHDRQTYTHPLLYATMKGHSDQVLDADFSSNQKYLVTCSEEDSNPGEDSTNSFNVSCLSRHRCTSTPKTLSLPSVVASSKLTKFKPLSQFLKLNLSMEQLCDQLSSYLLDPEHMILCAYPVESTSDPGRAVIYNISAKNYESFKNNLAKCGAHGKIEIGQDSGRGSGNSSGDDWEENCTTKQLQLLKGLKYTQRTAIKYTNGLILKISLLDSENNQISEHLCTRCNKSFMLKNDNEYFTLDNCHYHPGKLGTKDFGYFKNYSCCKRTATSPGCTIGDRHVWSGLRPDKNGPFDNYVQTQPCRNPSSVNCNIFALDCEMSYTACGLELTRITVISHDGRLEYESFVLPQNPIVDYNTIYSGVSAEDLHKSNHNVKTLRQVQNDLLNLVCAKSILIGHGLENDLRVLQILHTRVIDTAVLFPHFKGLPYRRTLKSLVSDYLNRKIQENNEGGHSSFEDAQACMELVLWRVRRDTI